MNILSPATYATLSNAALRTRLTEIGDANPSPFDAVARLVDVRQPTTMVDTARAAEARELYRAACARIDAAAELRAWTAANNDFFASEPDDDAGENERSALPLSAKRLPMPGPRVRQFGDFSRLGRR